MRRFGRFFGILRERDFRRLYAATTVSQVGYQVTVLALPLVAVETLVVDEFAVGVLTSLTTLAFLVLGLPAGAWVDRMRRRSVLVVCDLGRVVVLASVPLAWWTGMLTLAQLYAVALLLGAFTVFFDVAYQSYLPHLVGREHLVEGNAKLESVRAIAQIGGPGLGGSLVQVLTAPVALLADAIALALSAGFVVRISKREERPPRATRPNLVREISEGLGFVLGNRLLRAIAACTGTGNLFAALGMAMTVFFLRRDVGLEPGVIGVVLGSWGIGAVAGAFMARRCARRLGQGPALWIALATTTPFAFLLPLTEPGWRVWLAGAGGIVVSAGIVTYNVIQVSFRQALTPDHLLGRMNATMRFLVWGTQPIGALLGATLGSLLGARTALLISAAGMCTAFLPVYLSPLRRMRQLPAADREQDLTSPV